MSKPKIDGYCSRKVEYSGEEIYILKKTGSDEKADLDFLRRVETQLGGDKKADFYRRLLSEKSGIVSENEIKGYNVKGAKGYFAIAVKTGDTGDEEREAVAGVLDNIFFDEEGSTVVDLPEGKFAVVCVFKSDTGKKHLISLAETIEDTVSEQTMMPVKVGIGGIEKKVENIRDSFAQALIAAETEEKQYDRSRLMKLFSKVSESDTDRFIDDVLGRRWEEDKDMEELLETISVFLDCNMNISEASKTLFIHRNTLLYRIRKFKELTGLDATKFDDGMCIRAVCMALKLKRKEV